MSLILPHTHQHTQLDLEQSRHDYLSRKKQAEALHTHIPQTPRELWQYMAIVWNIKIPYRKVCPNHSPPFTAFCSAFFCTHPVVMWRAARKFGGKSYLLASLGLAVQATRGAEIKILGGTGEQSRRVLDYLKIREALAMGQFWDAEFAPKWLKDGDITAHTSYLINGGKLDCLMASEASVRGPHPQLLAIDELDCLKWDLFRSALPQPKDKYNLRTKVMNKSCVVLSSTWQVPDGTMTKAFKMADEKWRNWIVHEWCYREVLASHGGWLPDSEVLATQQTTDKYTWDIEFELGEPSMEGRVFDPAAIERAFDPALGIYDGTENETIIIEHPQTERANSGDVSYHTGTDWAKQVDWTVMATFKRGIEDPVTGKVMKEYPDTCVAWGKYGRRPWPMQVEILNQRLRDYHGASAHDATGIGGVLSDYLEVDSEPFIMGGGRARSEFFSAYITAIEHGMVRYPRIKSAYDDHRRCLAGGSLILTSRGEVPIQYIQVGDFVMTRSGWRPVYHKTCNGYRACISLNLSNGRKLTLTKDHPVATSSGWVEAGHLSLQSLLFSVPPVSLTPSLGVSFGVPSTSFLNSHGVIGSPLSRLHQVASPAHSTPTLLGHQVVSTVRMPTLAMCGSGRSTSGHIDLLGNGLEVLGITANAVSASVIQDQRLLRETSIVQEPSRSMCSTGQTSQIGLGITSLSGILGCSDTTFPVPTSLVVDLDSVNYELNCSWLSCHVESISRSDDRILVWDIGVVGEPEYVAEGILVHNCTWNDLFGSGHAPDAVVAGALAWHARQFGGVACGMSADESGNSGGNGRSAGGDGEYGEGEFRSFWRGMGATMGRGY